MIIEEHNPLIILSFICFVYHIILLVLYKTWKRRQNKSPAADPAPHPGPNPAPAAADIKDVNGQPAINTEDVALTVDEVTATPNPHRPPTVV